MQTRIDKLESKKNELKKKQDDLNRQIKMLKSKEAHEKKKQENHYKILLGAFLLKELSSTNIQIDDDMKKRLENFIQNTEKFNALVSFIEDMSNSNK